MDKSKQTPADKKGPGRTKRKPRDMNPEREAEWNPADDLYGAKVVDQDFDLGGGEFSTPPPRRG